MKYGIFVHYVWGGTAYPATVNPDGSLPAGLDDLADRFDAEKFAADLAAMKVQYVIFTAWHANMNCLWPCAPMDEWLPGHTPRRDVLRELIRAVRARGIAVILYAHPSDGHDLQPAEQEKTGWGPTFNRAKWNDFINDIFGDLVARYGQDILGIYLDENSGRNGTYVDYARLRQTIKAAHPNLVLIQNDYGNIYNCDFGNQEITGFDSRDGDAWGAMSLGSAVQISQNWWASVPQDYYAARYSPETIFRYTVLKAGIVNSAGGVAWAAGVYPGGNWEFGVFKTLERVADYLRPIGRAVTNTLPSTSFVTGSDATIELLDWGVATKSADDRFEFLHVLKPPAGKFLRLPPPLDGKHFSSARLLPSGHRVKLLQDESGLVLTLGKADAWNAIDTVIELSVAVPMNLSRQLTATGTNHFSASAPVPGMVRWFDAATLAATNGQPVSCWRDASGQHADAVRTAQLNPPPRFVADAGTGTKLGALHFASGLDIAPAVDSQALVFRPVTNLQTAFAVFKGSGFLLTDFQAPQFHRPDDTNAAAPLWDANYASPLVRRGQTYVNGALVDGTTFAMPTNQYNGFNLVTVVTDGPTTASGFNKDRFCHAGDQYFAEVLLYDFPLTDEQRRQTEAYLKAKWFGPSANPDEAK